MTTHIQADKDSDARMKKGMEMLQSGITAVENEDGSFTVPSQTGSNKSYEVRLLGKERFVCTCPDFEYRPIDTCKHIELVKFCAGMRYLSNQPKPKVFADDAMPCDKCGSIRTMKYGWSANKQVFKCKDCNHKFREPSLLKRARFTPELVSLTLDLYFSGLSLRKITRSVSDHYDIDVHYSTIYDWIQRYVPIVSEYIRTLTPSLSNSWHGDEVFLKMKGGKSNKMHKNIAYLWNVMDRRTRFLLASKLSEDRDAAGAVAAFKEAIANAQGIAPEYVFTDSLKSYNAGIKALEPAGLPVHVANCGVGKPHATNNRIERANGTLRERIKVQRGWKSIKTPLAEGQRIQYNFVKPHMALDGKTPAQAAGLQPKGWSDLMNLALKTKSAL
jgi:putative transposase